MSLTGLQAKPIEFDSHTGGTGITLTDDLMARINAATNLSAQQNPLGTVDWQNHVKMNQGGTVETNGAGYATTSNNTSQSTGLALPTNQQQWQSWASPQAGAERFDNTWNASEAADNAVSGGNQYGTGNGDILGADANTGGLLGNGSGVLGTDLSGMDVANIGAGLGNMYMGYKGYGLAKDQLNEAIKMNKENLAMAKDQLYGKVYDEDGAWTGEYETETKRDQTATSLGNALGGK